MLVLESNSGWPACGFSTNRRRSGGECTATPAVRPSSSVGENAAAELVWVRRIGKAGAVGGNPVVPAICACLCTVASNTLSAVVTAAVACVSLPGLQFSNGFDAYIPQFWAQVIASEGGCLPGR